MEINQLAEKLEPWMRVETWNSGHPLDEERFHKALSGAFENFGNSISFDDFYESLKSLAKKLYPKQSESPQMEKTIEERALKAETISSYLSDI